MNFVEFITGAYAWLSGWLESQPISLGVTVWLICRAAEQPFKEMMLELKSINRKLDDNRNEIRQKSYRN